MKGFLSALLLGAVAIARSSLAQTISDFEPSVGAPGDQVTIMGSGFSMGNIIRVYFSNQKLVTQGGIVSDSQIIAVVPNGAITGPITIQRDSDDPISSGGVFNVIGRGPYISDVSPLGGSVDDLVVISGVHLEPVTSVKFNGKLASDPSPNSAGTQITVHVPSGATTGPITVTTPAGSSNSPAPFTVLGSGPLISSFSPTFGNAGTKVNISGVHLGSVGSVVFGGVPAAGFFVSSETLIQAVVPANARTGPITVTSPTGTNSSITKFYAPPIISGFSPFTGRSATNVTISGTNLAGATTVLFGGTVATLFNANDNNNLYAVVPIAHSGSIQVFTPGFSVQSRSNFTFQPTVTSFVPASGKAGDTVVLLGANLNEGLSHVKFNDVDAAFSGVQAGQVSVKVPASATGPISVTTSNGTFVTVSTFYYPAVITGFAPTNAPVGGTITVTGINFSGATAVFFNGQSAAFTLLDNNTMTVVVPPGVTTGPIAVTTPAGTFSSGTQLFYGPPVVAGFNPTHGLPGAGVTILGNNFIGAAAVRFNGINVTGFSVLDNSTIQTSVPKGSTTGPITVIGPGGSATSAANFIVDFASDLVLRTSDTPDPVFWGSNLVYSITVTNAGPSDATHTVISDTLPASLLYKSATTTKGTVGAQGNVVTAALGTLLLGETAQVTLTVVPQVLNYVTNSIRVFSDYPDPNAANNTNVLMSLVLPLPWLEIRSYSPSQWQILWPVLLTNYILESKPLLSANADWSNVTSTPLISGTNKFVIEIKQPGSRYYRLKD